MTREELHQWRAARWATWLAEARSGRGLADLLSRAGLAPWQRLPGQDLGHLSSLAADDHEQTTLQAELEALLADGQAFELGLWPAPVYMNRDLLPAIFAWIGPRTHEPALRDSQLSAEILSRLAVNGALTTTELRQRLGVARTSQAAIEQAALELTRSLRVLRVGRTAAGEARWQASRSFWPELEAGARDYSRTSSLSNLLLPILEQWRLSTEAELEHLLQPFAPIHALRSTLAGLEIARRIRSASLAGIPAWEWVEINDADGLKPGDEPITAQP